MKIIMKAREGVTLVEVVVAMTLLAVALSSLAVATFSASSRSVKVAGSGYMNGIVTQELNRVASMPFANLAAAAGCMTVSSGVFPHQRCIFVTDLTGTEKQVRIIVTPAQRGVLPDTVIVRRSNPPAGNPLNM
jgi:prepilin-type N-terminal cleavage/methylation domain-containing protein